jgi:hypothetical protein
MSSPFRQNPAGEVKAPPSSIVTRAAPMARA